MAGCNGSGTGPTAPTPATAQPSTPTNIPTAKPEASKAQPRLRTMKLYLGAEELTAELALTMEQQRMGMMYRESMAENEGMLFVTPRTQRASFWMKNTTVHLSAAYIDPEGVILEIHELKPLDTNPVRANSDQIQYVLEVNYGWFERHNIREGMVVATEHGSLRETFFGK